MQTIKENYPIEVAQELERRFITLLKMVIPRNLELASKKIIQGKQDDTE